MNITTNKGYFESLKKKLAGGAHYNFRTLSEESPRFYTKGKGAKLWDIEGKEYVDFYAKFGAMILGHNHPEFNDAIIEQTQRLLCVNHSTFDIEVCDLLQSCFPSFELMRFGLSGTEIVQNAIRLSRAYTGKNKFLRFEGHYHGNADNILGGKSISNSNPPIPIEFKGDPRGTAGRVFNTFENESFILPWNDIESLKAVLENHGDEIACLIMEPALINGGGIAPIEGYLKKVKSLCKKHNCVLIFDEVITGLRFGLSGAQGFYGVQPDLTLLGKAIGNGIPVSVIGGKKEILKLYETRQVIHAGTFNGHPLGMAAIKATLSILKGSEADFYEKSNYYTNEIKSSMKCAADELGLPLNIQTFGSMLIFNACNEKVTKSNEISIETIINNLMFFNKMSENGILVAPISRMFFNAMLNENDLQFFKLNIRPALTAAKKEIDNIFDRSAV